MSDEYLNQEISCEYCGKIVKFNDMEDWFKLLEVTRDMESNPEYFCSFKCLKASVNEHTILWLERIKQQKKDRKWEFEEKKDMHPSNDSEEC